MWPLSSMTFLRLHLLTSHVCSSSSSWLYVWSNFKKCIFVDLWLHLFTQSFNEFVFKSQNLSPFSCLALNFLFFFFGGGGAKHIPWLRGLNRNWKNKMINILFIFLSCCAKGNLFLLRLRFLLKGMFSNFTWREGLLNRLQLKNIVNFKHLDFV